MEILTPAQVEQFHRNGYLKFTRVLAEDQVQRLRDALDRVIREEQEREDDSGRPPEFAYGHDRRADLKAGGQRPARAIHQFVNMWKVVPEYREVIHNPKITGAIRDLMGADRIRLWHDQVISKPPGDNAHFSCHHDFYFWPLDRPTMITCWLALDDATVANGCMHVIPGSHRDPRFQPVGCDLSEDIHLSPAPLGPGEPGSLYQEVRTWGPERAVPVELKAGECMFHHCLNYHMTPQNVTDRQRRAFVIIYMPDGTRYNHAQSPNHPCTNYLHLADGTPLTRDEFPICGEGTASA
ncbi:MAG TPA: phytanoyl-CoA dioxygenase family protein [Chthonomonadaceae bacterium]|nr:phytanoyl-CoA dioxygenase family protein [Chthonomonadaceae bacterium]